MTGADRVTPTTAVAVVGVGFRPGCGGWSVCLLGGVRSITGHLGFGEVLRGHRRAARLTLEQLAGVSGVSARTLSDMERGRSKVTRIVATYGTVNLSGQDHRNKNYND
jgi:hypothetical protein